jgi:hypothetical protein
MGTMQSLHAKAPTLSSAYPKQIRRRLPWFRNKREADPYSPFPMAGYCEHGGRNNMREENPPVVRFK